MTPDTEAVVDAVAESRKYRNVCPDVIQRLAEMELQKRSGVKAAVKATKNKLHQIGGAYFEGRSRYDAWLEELRTATRAGRDEAKVVCRQIMQHHVSTRERTTELETFYAKILRGLMPIRTVVDLACGLNPLSVPWIPIAADAVYLGYDMYSDLAEFLSGCLDTLGVIGRVESVDVLSLEMPMRPDLALLLKALPCLEQLDKTEALALLDRIDAEYLLLSFPVQSIGGRGKGMEAHYDAQFRELLQDRGWHAESHRCGSELAFLVTK